MSELSSEMGAMLPEKSFLPETDVRPIDIEFNAKVYNKIYSPRRPNEEAPKTRYRHIDRHRGDFEAHWGVHSTREALGVMAEIAQETNPQKVRQYIDLERNRLIVYHLETQMAIIIQEEPDEYTRKPPPPPGVVISAYHQSVNQVQKRLSGESRGALWKAAQYVSQ